MIKFALQAGRARRSALPAFFVPATISKEIKIISKLVKIISEIVKIILYDSFRALIRKLMRAYKIVFLFCLKIFRKSVSVIFS